MTNLLAGLVSTAAAAYCFYAAKRVTHVSWGKPTMYVFAGANIVMAAQNFLIVLVR